jgi:acid phosphatase (class A)
MKRHQFIRFARLGCVASVFLGLALAPALAAQSGFLTNDPSEFLILLAPPPLAGSNEAAADLATVASAHGTASQEDLAMAQSEARFNVYAFAPAIGVFFNPGKTPETEAFFKRIHRDSDRVVDAGKVNWKRLRPLNADPTLNPKLHDQAYSYPSGHSTRATIYALLLSEIFPDRREAIMATARTLGWHRVQMALHYPTDIVAGRVLAQAIVRKLKEDPAFQHDFAEVTAELKAAERQGSR